MIICSADVSKANGFRYLGITTQFSRNCVTSKVLNNILYIYIYCIIKYVYRTTIPSNSSLISTAINRLSISASSQLISIKCRIYGRIISLLNFSLNVLGDFK